ADLGIPGGRQQRLLTYPAYVPRRKVPSGQLSAWSNSPLRDLSAGGAGGRTPVLRLRGRSVTESRWDRRGAAVGRECGAGSGTVPDEIRGMVPVGGVAGD